MTKPIREKLIEVLSQLGEREVFTQRTSKYVVITRWLIVTDGSPRDQVKVANSGFWYIGKNGALRTGNTATTSVPMDSIKAFLLKQWDKSHGQC